MGRSLGFLTTLVGLVAVVFVVWWLRQDPVSGPAPPGRPPFFLPVTLTALEGGTLQPSIELTGTVRAPERARLAFESAGVIVELKVRAADSFAEQDVLARLRSSKEELAVATAQAELDLALRQNDRLLAGPREEEIARLAAGLAERVANEAFADAELRRREGLSESELVSKTDIGRLSAARNAARARTEAAAQELAQAEAGTRAEDLAISRAQVDLAQAKLAQAQEAQARTTLIATRAGVVLARLAAPGDFVAVGAPVLEVIDLRQLEVELEVPPGAAEQLGDRPLVHLTSDDLPGFALDTRLTALVPAADERTRNFRGILRLPAGESEVARLQPGAFVRARIDLMPFTGALKLPQDAVRVTPNGRLIVRANAGDDGALVAEVIPVRVIASAGQTVAVESLGPPIAAGESFVLTGVDLAFHGAALLVSRPVEN